MNIHGPNLWATVALAVAVGGCTSPPGKPGPRPETVRAHVLPDPPKPIEVVEVPRVLPLPGQMKPIPEMKVSTHEPRDPKERVSQANVAARVEPLLDNYVNATQLWPYSPDALYQVYASPERITDIELEAGEELVSVSAGDTVRWVIGDTTSGAGATQRVHVLVC